MVEINYLNLTGEKQESLPNHYYVREVLNLGLANHQVYDAVNKGLLRTIKKGKFLLINKEDADNLVDKLENSYSALEVSKILEITSQQVRSKIREGQLKAFKIGKVYRISKETLDDFVKDYRKWKRV